MEFMINRGFLEICRDANKEVYSFKFLFNVVSNRSVNNNKRPAIFMKEDIFYVDYLCKKNNLQTKKSKKKRKTLR